eukprot:233089-Hanusia_phi.AAC.1
MAERVVPSKRCVRRSRGSLASICSRCLFGPRPLDMKRCDCHDHPFIESYADKKSLYCRAEKF